MIRVASRPVKEKNVMQTLYLNSDQTKELITSIGANAVVVFTHYIAIAHQPNPNMEDEQLAKLTGLSEQTVKRTRLALTELGWFQRIKGTYKGQPQITYLVGKQAVASSRHAVLRVKESSIKDPAEKDEE